MATYFAHGREFGLKMERVHPNRTGDKIPRVPNIRNIPSPVHKRLGFGSIHEFGSLMGEFNLIGGRDSMAVQVGYHALFQQLGRMSASEKNKNQKGAAITMKLPSNLSSIIEE